MSVCSDHAEQGYGAERGPPPSTEGNVPDDGGEIRGTRAREHNLRDIDVRVVSREKQSPHFQTVFASGVK